MFREHPWADPKIVAHCQLLRNNFTKYFRRDLIDYELSGKEFSFFLYNSSFVIVSHGTESDPVFNYANKTAQDLWEFPWEEFTKLPSRFSVEQGEVKERQKLLDETIQKGYSENYSGIRITKSGKRFEIKNILLYNLYDDQGAYKGQAAMFEKWEYV